MKNVDKLYEKYYDTYKSSYENNDELNEAKKENLNFKQFEIVVDKTFKELKLDGQTKNFNKETEKREKGVDKNGCTKHFGYEPSALVSKLLIQNKQDLRKSLHKIKKQMIELDKDETNSTNNRNENDRLNMIQQSVIGRIYQFFKNKFLPDEQPDKLKLPKWVNVSKERFNEILNITTEAKNNGSKTSLYGE